jgi:hypothetical protein
MNSANMAAKKISKKRSKSDFIRSQPSSMSPTDVVAAAKAAGITMSRNLVYMVRARKGGATKAPSKPQKPATTGESKADFVRARSHLSPKEIVEDATDQGMKLDATYVYNVRGYDKTMAKKQRQPAKAAAPSASEANRSSRSASAVEDLLRAVAAELGLGRAIQILQAERARVHAVIGA